MSTNLITGYAGKSHITSAGDGAVNAAVLGNGRYVLDIAEKFAYELISNNQIRIKSGYAVDQGRKIELAVNDYEELTIDNGLQGVKRCDLIAITYEKNLGTGIETAIMNVIKGTSGDNYIDPKYTVGDIIAGDIKDDFLLYRVKINGLSIESVETLFEVRKSVEKMDTLENIVTFKSDDVADGLASAWTSVSKLSSGEKHYSIFAKMSQMFKNVRYLYKMFGTTDISAIGNGTCTGAISTLNSSLANKSFIKIVKHDWSGLIGSLTPLINSSDKYVVDLLAHNEENDTYPPVRVARADADHDGNRISDTYLKKADVKNNVSGLSNTITNYNDQTPVAQYFTVPDDGYYLVTGLVTFASNPNGFREVFITNTSANYVMGRVRVPAISGGVTTLQVTSGGTFEPGQTGTLSTYQNSGSNLNVHAWVSMVKIAPKL